MNFKLNFSTNKEIMEQFGAPHILTSNDLPKLKNTMKFFLPTGEYFTIVPDKVRIMENIYTVKTMRSIYAFEQI